MTQGAIAKALHEVSGEAWLYQAMSRTNPPVRTAWEIWGLGEAQYTIHHTGPHSMPLLSRPRSAYHPYRQDGDAADLHTLRFCSIQACALLLLWQYS